MKNFVILFILAIMVIGGSSCRYHTGYYYGKTSTHYGKSKRTKMKHAYWGRHKGGYSGHASRGRYR